MNELAPVRNSPAPSDGPANWLQLMDTAAAVNPLKMLPHDWRPQVGRLWLCNSHLLPSALAICGTLRDYKDQGLESADVPRLVAYLMEPERRQGHRFASDLFCDLHSWVRNQLHRKRAAAETAARRRESQPYTGILAGLEIAQLFRTPGESDEAPAQADTRLPGFGGRSPRDPADHSRASEL